jgi:hypothetical protein
VNNYFKPLGSNDLEFWGGQPFKVYFGAGIGKLQHVTPIWFLCSLHDRSGPSIFKLLRKEIKDQYFMTCENYMKFIYQCAELKLYYNVDALICLPVICGCFELSSKNTDCTACKAWNVYFLILVGKRLPISVLEDGKIQGLYRSLSYI